MSIIRRAQAGDLPALQDLMNTYRRFSTAIWNHNLCTEEDMKAWFAEHNRGGYCAFVAEEQGRILGYASLSPFRFSGYEITAENSVYVLPGLEGRGLGKALMERVIAQGRQDGLRVITAWIDAENEGSVRFHQRLGFSMAGTLKNCGRVEGQIRSVHIMELEL